jgi:hypothetical protein
MLCYVNIIKRKAKQTFIIYEVLVIYYLLILVDMISSLILILVN